MNFLRIFVLAGVLAVLIGGCKQGQSAPATTTPLADTPDTPTQAQPKLPTIKLYIGPKEVEAEVAITEQQTRIGMMFRTEMAEDNGMLFVFPIPHRSSFWMKNCPLPLSVAYIDPKGVIEEIHDMQPHNTNSVVAHSDNIRFALEMNQGWFKKNGIEPGASVRTPKGTLKETFPLQNR